MNFDPFVLPFTIGFNGLVLLLIVKYGRWFISLDPSQRNKIFRNILSVHSLNALKEIFSESLLHRKVFRANPKLGYMHMSLAFGWFLLIVAGKVEVTIYEGDIMHAPYLGIFFRYFVTDTDFPLAGVFKNLMDLILLFILTGLGFAIAKRFSSRQVVGMKRTTKHSFKDKTALIALWWIFPLRLLAESLTAANFHNGGIITNNLGGLLDEILPADMLYYLFWWLYSLSLGAFFVFLPFSRYMHIPTEIVLIFLRNWGVKISSVATLEEIEIEACPGCGICLDICPLSNLNHHRSQSVYFLRKLRQGKYLDNQEYDCLQCGRCQEFCPVGIDLNHIRLSKREDFSMVNRNPEQTHPIEIPKPSKVLFFAGCMTHLTPGIIQAMKKIFETAGVSYAMMDEQGGVCCGRPMVLAGQREVAKQIIAENTKIICQSGAERLITSCPICYKAFRESYNLDISVMHHSEYLLDLVRNEQISLYRKDVTCTYHDPCELGRGSNVYYAPRELLGMTGLPKVSDNEKDKSMCCGGSLANHCLSAEERGEIAKRTVLDLSKQHPDFIATACPLCKKTLNQYSTIDVKDISELVVGAMLPSINDPEIEHLFELNAG